MFIYLQYTVFWSILVNSIYCKLHDCCISINTQMYRWLFKFYSRIVLPIKKNCLFNRKMEITFFVGVIFVRKIVLYIILSFACTEKPYIFVTRLSFCFSPIDLLENLIMLCSVTQVTDFQNLQNVQQTCIFISFISRGSQILE